MVSVLFSYVAALLASVFAVSSLSKLAARRSWVETLQNLALLPPRLIPVAAIGLPVLEIATSAMLVFGAAWSTSVGAALAA